MTTVRVLAEDDLAETAALFMRLSVDSQWRDPCACENYFRRILLENPWCDMRLPSWVAEDDGRIVGFNLMIPRPMKLHNRPIQAAIGCQFIVDPKHRHSLAALQLAQAGLSGPQDLTLADGANDQARTLWLGIGGEAPLLYNLQWTRLLRPLRFTETLMAGRGVLPRALLLALRPAATVADSLASRHLSWNGFLHGDDGLVDVNLDTATMYSYLSEIFADRVLRPVYSPDSLAWLLDEAARKTGVGTLRARLVRDGGQSLGWYLYYVRRGGVCEVLQIAANPGSFDAVLKRLLTDAWQQGAAAVRGRAEPRHIDELSARHCWFRREGPAFLLHSRDRDILNAIRGNDAFLSRLEGEWWLRFARA